MTKEDCSEFAVRKIKSLRNVYRKKRRRSRRRKRRLGIIWHIRTIN